MNVAILLLPDEAPSNPDFAAAFAAAAVTGGPAASSAPSSDPSPPPGRMEWVCDVCQAAAFSDYSAAVAHEKACALGRRGGEDEEEKEEVDRPDDALARTRIRREVTLEGAPDAPGFAAEAEEEQEARAARREEGRAALAWPRLRREVTLDEDAPDQSPQPETHPEMHPAPPAPASPPPLPATAADADPDDTDDIEDPEEEASFPPAARHRIRSLRDRRRSLLAALASMKDELGERRREAAAWKDRCRELEQLVVSAGLAPPIPLVVPETVVATPRLSESTKKRKEQKMPSTPTPISTPRTVPESGGVNFKNKKRKAEALSPSREHTLQPFSAAAHAATSSEAEKRQNDGTPTRTVDRFCRLLRAQEIAANNALARSDESRKNLIQLLGEAKDGSSRPVACPHGVWPRNEAGEASGGLSPARLAATEPKTNDERKATGCVPTNDDAKAEGGPRPPSASSDVRAPEGSSTRTAVVSDAVGDARKSSGPSRSAAAGPMPPSPAAADKSASPGPTNPVPPSAAADNEPKTDDLTREAPIADNGPRPLSADDDDGATAESADDSRGGAAMTVIPTPPSAATGDPRRRAAAVRAPPRNDGGKCAKVWAKVWAEEWFDLFSTRPDASEARRLMELRAEAKAMLAPPSRRVSKAELRSAIAAVYDRKEAEGRPPPRLAAGVCAAGDVLGADPKREVQIAAGPRPFSASDDEVTAESNVDSGGAATVGPLHPSAATVDGEVRTVLDSTGRLRCPADGASSRAGDDRTSSPSQDGAAGAAISTRLSALARVAAIRRSAAALAVETDPLTMPSAINPARPPSTAAGAGRTIAQREDARAERDEPRNDAPQATAAGPSPPLDAAAARAAEPVDEVLPPSIPSPFAGAAAPDDEWASEPRNEARTAPPSLPASASNDEPTACPSNVARAKASPTNYSKAARIEAAVRTANAARMQNEARPAACFMPSVTADEPQTKMLVSKGRSLYVDATASVAKAAKPTEEAPPVFFPNPLATPATPNEGCSAKRCAATMPSAVLNNGRSAERRRAASETAPPAVASLPFAASDDAPPMAELPNETTAAARVSIPGAVVAPANPDGGRLRNCSRNVEKEGPAPSAPAANERKRNGASLDAALEDDERTPESWNEARTTATATLPSLPPFAFDDKPTTAGPLSEARAKGCPLIPAKEATRTVNAARNKSDARPATGLTPPTDADERQSDAQAAEGPSTEVAAAAASVVGAAKLVDEQLQSKFATASAKGSPSIPMKATRTMDAVKTQNEARPAACLIPSTDADDPQNKARGAEGPLPEVAAASVVRATKLVDEQLQSDLATTSASASPPTSSGPLPRKGEPATASTSTSPPTPSGPLTHREPYSCPLENIETPHPQDVLCGRGGGSNNHIGNTQWRTLVALNKRLYIKLPKLRKMLLAKSIVDSVKSQNPPGRFLQQDASSETWFEIGDRKAVDKTSQALREGAQHIRQEMKDEQEKLRKTAVAAARKPIMLQQWGQQQFDARPFAAGMPRFPFCPPTPTGAPVIMNGMPGPPGIGPCDIHAHWQGGASRKKHAKGSTVEDNREDGLPP